MWQWIIGIVYSLLSIADKSVKTAEERKNIFEVKKPRLAAEELEKVQDRAFRRTRNKWEVPIADDIRLVNNDMDKEQQAELIANVERMVYKYRVHRPRRFATWLAGSEAARIREM